MLSPVAALANPLSVCIDRASPTAQADRKLAEAVASVQHVKLDAHLFDGSGEGADGLDARDFAGLLAKTCDLVIGFPTEPGSNMMPPGAVATAPYGSTAFVLALADGIQATSLDDLPDGTEVAVTYGTAPNLFLVQHPKLKPNLLSTDTETIQTLISSADKAAMMWHPTLASTPAASHFSVHALNFPHARWNLVALRALAAADQAAQFDAAVATLKTSGELARVLAPYGIDPAVGAETAMSRHSEKTSANFILPAAFSQTTGGTQTPPALYTAAQAAAGAQKFADNCAQCHGDKLEGVSGPALKGALFASEKADFTVGDILQFITVNMPATQPGSLPQGDYVQIMTFLLQQNGYPAGTSELKFDTAKVSKIPLRYYGR